MASWRRNSRRNLAGLNAGQVKPRDALLRQRSLVRRRSRNPVRDLRVALHYAAKYMRNQAGEDDFVLGH
jgi:hypothetical protein